jgi:hypothetical protein
MAPDGIYQIDPDGMGGGMPISAYCDMTTDGGGWTMVFKLSSGVAGDANNLWTGAALNENDMALLDLKKATKHYVSGLYRQLLEQGRPWSSARRARRSTRTPRSRSSGSTTPQPPPAPAGSPTPASPPPPTPTSRPAPSITTRSPATPPTAAAGSSTATMVAAPPTPAGSSSTAPPTRAAGRPTSTPRPCASSTPPASASPSGRPAVDNNQIGFADVFAVFVR